MLNFFLYFYNSHKNFSEYKSKFIYLFLKLLHLLDVIRAYLKIAEKREYKKSDILHQINLEVSNTSRINQSFPISKLALKS